MRPEHSIQQSLAEDQQVNQALAANMAPRRPLWPMQRSTIAFALILKCLCTIHLPGANLNTSLSESYMARYKH